MRTPMPSPLGTNRAQLFIGQPSSGVAYDSADGLSQVQPVLRRSTAARWGAEATRKALRQLGMDKSETEGEQEQGWEMSDEEDAEGVETCGLDKWTAYKKARDSRLRRQAARDEEKDDLPEAGKTANDRAAFFERYPGASSIKIDTMATPERVRPTPAEAAARARLAMDGDSGGFEKRFPTASRIQVR